MLQDVLSFLKKKYTDFVVKHMLPCAVFCRDPLILVSYDMDFTSNAPVFLDVFAKSRAKSIHVFLQLGWEHETPENALPFAEKIKSVQEQCPRLKVTILANSENEVSVLSGLGLRTVFCNQNAFVDESRYPLLKRPKKFDAIYIARITPFKRHALAKMVSSLNLVGDPSLLEKEKAYINDIKYNQLKHAKWSGHINGKDIPAEIAEARCGLCLSKAEGAMFASIEYLLCGIPIVNTQSLGGRDVMFPDFAVKTVPATPEAVAEAVQEFVEHAPEPEKIRAAALEKMKVHRETFRRLLNEAMSPKSFPDSQPLPHKFSLRCMKTPLQLLRYGLRNSTR